MVKINKGIEIQNSRTDLESMLVDTLDEFGITLRQPYVDLHCGELSIIRHGKKPNLEITHKKNFDGNDVHQYLGISSPKFGGEKYGDDIWLIIENDKDITDIQPSDEQAEKYVNKALYSLQMPELKDYKDLRRFLGELMRYTGYHSREEDNC